MFITMGFLYHVLGVTFECGALTKNVKALKSGQGTPCHEEIQKLMCLIYL